MIASPCVRGHKLVEFTEQERTNFEKYVNNGGFVFVDDCNHDIDGLFAKSFESQMERCFGEGSLKKIPKNHPIYSTFFTFDGPPATSQELNGWGDELIHDYLKAIECHQPAIKIRQALKQQQYWSVKEESKKE